MKFNSANLEFIRQIPIIGARLAETFRQIELQSTATEQQSNTNPFAQPEPPPGIDNVSATGQNGVLHVSITHQATGLRRGVQYYVEHADNPQFVNPQIRNIGDTRSFSEFIGNDTRYVKAYAAYPASPAGAIAYHGSPVAPTPVYGGGSVGPPRYLPSQGSGTGAAGQGGHGPGPLAERSSAVGFDWTLQRAQGLQGGFPGQGTPAQQALGTVQGSGGSSLIVPWVVEDTHAARASYPALNYQVGTLYYETDRTVFYIVKLVTAVKTWVYADGEMQATQGALPTLGTADAGFVANVTDYGHRLKWSGSAWGWAPGDNGSGYIQGFLVDPSPTTGWQLCDGSAGVNYLKADGTLGTVTVPALTTSPAYLKYGAAVTGINAPTAPTFTGSNFTPAGTIAATFSGTPAAPTGTNSVPMFTGSALATHQHDSPIGPGSPTPANLTTAFGSGSTQASASQIALLAGSGTFATLKVSAVSAGTPSGTVSAPNFTGDPFTPAGTVAATFTGTPAPVSGTISTTGQPQNIVLKPWFRV